ncbi:MAG: prepilin peptidase [Proteobacteria bacterium]|nr:prepilin peptidase [Pseudomonadota bacterium]
MHTITAIALLVFPALMIASAISDLTTMTIPNRITGALILAFFPAAIMAGLSPSAILACVGVGAACLVGGAVMFALRWIGGGDAKVIAGAGLWLGVSGIGPFLMWTAVAGGLFGLSLLFARSWAQPYVGYGPRWVGRLLEPKGDIPYGVAIAVGALAAFPQCALMLGNTGVF